MRRALLSLILALSVMSATTLPALAGHHDNVSDAVTTKDGATVFDLAFDIQRVMSDTVDQVNAAVAYTSCEECTAVAIAIQVIFIISDPSVVTPTNLAIAVTEECSGCVAAAYAYQFVMTVGGHVHFTAEGNRALAKIRKDLRELRDLVEEGVPPAELKVALDDIVARLRDVLENELVVVAPGGRDEDEPVSEEEGQATPVPAPTPPETSSTSSPEPSTSPSSPSPSATTSPVEASPDATTPPATP